MSRNIKLNATYMKTLSKQNTDMQLDFDLSSFQTSNNFSKKNSVNDINTITFTNSSNTSKHCTNSKLKTNYRKNDIFTNFSIFSNATNHNNKSRSKYLHNNDLNYLLQNNSLNKDNNSMSQMKKRLKTKENNNPHFLYFKTSTSIINKTLNNNLNTSKNSKMKRSKEKSKKTKTGGNFSMKKSNTSKILNINIKKCNNRNWSRKLGSPGLNKIVVKTNINSPLESDRKQKQIIILSSELKNKDDEIIKLKNRISEQDKYIFDLENKIKSLRKDKSETNEEYEQYSKKMILRNIKVLTTENEELNKQINEYKEKQIKIMKALYYIKKIKGISIDSFLDNDNDGKNEKIK